MKAITQPFGQYLSKIMSLITYFVMRHLYQISWLWN